MGETTSHLTSKWRGTFQYFQKKNVTNSIKCEENMKWERIIFLNKNENFNYFMASLRGKNQVEVKFENSMHNYNATLVHWHHTLGCQCSSFGTYAVHKMVTIRILITEKCNYFMTSLWGKNQDEVKFENSMHNYNATLVHWHHTLGCQCNSFGTYDVHKVVPVRLLITEKLNYFMTSLRGKMGLRLNLKTACIKNYNATLVHWHHTLGCQCSSFGTYAVHKVVPVRVLIAKKLNYFTTSLRGKNKVEVQFENSMHIYNASLVHWYHTLECQCSSFGTYAVHKVGPVKQSKPYWRTDGQTDRWTDRRTDGNHQSNSRVGYTQPPKNWHGARTCKVLRNTAMRFRVTVRKLKVTDRRTFQYLPSRVFGVAGDQKSL